MIGLVAGAVKGANATLPDTAPTIEAALRQSIADRDLQADLRQRVVNRAPAGSASRRLDLGVGDTVDPAPTPDYARFAAGGVDTVLEIGIAEVRFTGEGSSDPDFVLSITARARVIRLPDNRVLSSDPQMTFDSARAKQAAWTAMDARLLKSEIDRGLEALATQIREKVF